MSNTITIKCGVNLTIRRPNGITETVKMDRFGTLTPALFARIKAETKKAGRGDVLSWEQLTREEPMPEAWAQAAAAERQYNAGRAAVYRAMDARAETDAVDNTPAHPSDL